MRPAIVLVLAACSGPARPRLPPPAAAPPPIYDLDRGVLRSLMIQGALQVPIDDETRAALVANERAWVVADVSVCLDAEGVATTALVQPSRYPAYDAAVHAAIAGWRFRPYVRDGAAAPACSTARFAGAIEEGVVDGVKVPPGPRDALPEPAIELPASVESSGVLPPRETDEPPTPGVALAVVCREQGARAAPSVMLVQSSGDPAIDRGLLDRRVAMPRSERAGGEACVLASAITPSGSLPAAGTMTADELQLRRISGDRVIVPSDLLKNVLREDRRNGSAQLVAHADVCVDGTGRVDIAAMRGSSGYLGYDADLVNRIATWRYRPLIFKGRPVRTCTDLHFIYRQRH